MKKLLIPFFIIASTAIGATVVLNAFNRGEMSPQLEGRTDIQAYYAGVRTLENMVPLPHGAVLKRPGIYHIAAASDTNSNVMLIPFEFSVSQAYVIEAGDGYFRFYKEN